jgi:hypothetical protein
VDTLRLVPMDSTLVSVFDLRRGWTCYSYWPTVIEKPLSVTLVRDRSFWTPKGSRRQRVDLMLFRNDATFNSAQRSGRLFSAPTLN